MKRSLQVIANRLASAVGEFKAHDAPDAEKAKAIRARLSEDSLKLLAKLLRKPRST